MAVGEPAQQPIHVSPFGPVAGASAEETIRGFLSAGYGFEDDHAVARSFLTQAASDAWKPDTGVTVHGDTDASVKVTVSGRDGAGGTSPIAVRRRQRLLPRGGLRAPVARGRSASPGWVASGGSPRSPRVSGCG